MALFATTISSFVVVFLFLLEKVVPYILYPHIFHLSILFFFFLGLALVLSSALSESVKTISSLFMGLILWTLLFHRYGYGVEDHSFTCLYNTLFDLLYIFLTTILIQTIHAQNGFPPLYSLCSKLSPKQLLWAVGTLTFFLSSRVYPLMVAVGMFTFIRGYLEDKKSTSTQLIYASAIVLAANAGSGWTLQSDIIYRLCAFGVLQENASFEKLLWQNVFACSVSFLCLGSLIGKKTDPSYSEHRTFEPKKITHLLLFLAALVLPWYLPGISSLPLLLRLLFAFCLVWMATQPFSLSKTNIFANVDILPFFFFATFVFSLRALDASGIAIKITSYLNTHISSQSLMISLSGIVAGALHNATFLKGIFTVFHFEDYPPDSLFWHQVAFAVTFGGNLLLMGSTCGIALMCLEKVSYFWYFRVISYSVFAGYVTGFLLTFLIY